MLNFLLISTIVLFFILLIYFLCKYVKAIPKESEKYLGYIQILFLILGFLFAGLLTNHLVQPLIQPRVSEITIKPLYIQTTGSFPKKPDYYGVFEVTYNIDVPLFPLDKNINLRLPGDYTARERLYFITKMFRKDPYFKLNLDEERLETLLPYEKIDGSVNITILTDGFKMKKIEVKFLVAEKIPFDEMSISHSDFYWWTDTSIAPEIINRNVITNPYGSILGYGTCKPLNAVRSFHDLAIKNLADVEIRGHKIRVADESQIWCYEGIKLDIEYLEDGSYVSIDLEPNETKHLLILKPVNPSDVNKKSFQFDYWSETECPGAWLKYKELMGFN